MRLQSCVKALVVWQLASWVLLGCPYVLLGCQPSARGCLSGGECKDGSVDVHIKQTCSYRTELRDCGGAACNLQTGTCAQAAPYSLSLCKPCETDRECEKEACVELLRNGHHQGRYCLLPYERSAGCPRGMKQVIGASRTSETMVRAYCAPFELATCQALEVFESKQMCRNSELNPCAFEGSFCDEGFTDPMDNSVDNICTVLCGDENDCPRGARCIQSSQSGRRVCRWPAPT